MGFLNVKLFIVPSSAEILVCFDSKNPSVHGKHGERMRDYLGLLIRRMDNSQLWGQDFIKVPPLPHETTITVDASQGKEYDFVLFDLATPGAGYGLGFMSDPKRACVALSPARYGLVIHGSKYRV